MAVRIRLTRTGAKNSPLQTGGCGFRSPRDGRFIEILGHYNPITEPSVVKVDEERAVYWLLNGAKPSDTARALLKKAGVMEKYEEARRTRTQQAD